MATMYLVQAFKQAGKKLVAEPVQQVKTAEKAIATAERLAPSRAGVLAFSQEVDVETDTYDEPRGVVAFGDAAGGVDGGVRLHRPSPSGLPRGVFT